MCIVTISINSSLSCSLVLFFCLFRLVLVMMFSKHSPGGECPRTLFSSCSVWAWRKPGINSWLRAEPTCRTAFRKGHPKSLKIPEKVKTCPFLYGNTFRIPGPQTRKKTPTIYIYIKGCQKRGCRNLISGFKKRGVFYTFKTSKTPKISLSRHFSR